MYQSAENSNLPSMNMNTRENIIIKQFKTVKERIEFLKQLIQYYEAGTYPFIHPTEKVPLKSISKRQYNKLKKVCPKVPEYPKSTHLTKKLEELFNKYRINPFTV